MCESVWKILSIFTFFSDIAHETLHRRGFVWNERKRFYLIRCWFIFFHLIDNGFNPSSRKKFMKVIKMVNWNFNDNHKNFRSRAAREFSIECGLCWYEVQKHRGYGLLNDALEVLERFWHGFGILVFLREKFQFYSDDCELDVVIENIYVSHGHVLR